MSATTPYTAATLPANANVGPLAFCLEVAEELFIRHGKVIAYYGALKFETLARGVLQGPMKKAFRAPRYRGHFTKAAGRGKVLLADDGRDVAAHVLAGERLMVRAEHLLAFGPALTCHESFLRGYLVLEGTGPFVMSSNGPVLTLEAPCRVDEDALVAFTDMPAPAYRYDLPAIKNAAGAARMLLGLSKTGDERQLDFAGPGRVMVQASELAVTRGMAGGA